MLPGSPGRPTPSLRAISGGPVKSHVSRVGGPVRPSCERRRWLGSTRSVAESSQLLLQRLATDPGALLSMVKGCAVKGRANEPRLGDAVFSSDEVEDLPRLFAENVEISDHPFAALPWWARTAKGSRSDQLESGQLQDAGPGDRGLTWHRPFSVAGRAAPLAASSNRSWQARNAALPEWAWAPDACWWARSR
jgi:hypothetical protein